MRVEFTLKGRSALLPHADDVEMSDELSEWRKDPDNKNLSVAGDDRSPPWTWINYLYSDGQYVSCPSYNLMVCLRAAGTQLILKKQKTFKEITQSGIIMESEFLTLLSGGEQIPYAPLARLKGGDYTFRQHVETVRKMGFDLLVKRARVGQAKHIRVRAKLTNWKVRGTLFVTAPEITFEKLQSLFEIGGRVGLLDWRPGCKTPGPYGMFDAELKQLKSAKVA